MTLYLSDEKIHVDPCPHNDILLNRVERPLYYFRCLDLKLHTVKYTNKCVQIKNIPSSNVLQKSFPMQSAKLLRKFVLPRQTKLLKVKEKILHNLHSGIPHRFLKNKISNIPFIYQQKTNKHFHKVSFFVQCMKKQLITIIVFSA